MGLALEPYRQWAQEFSRKAPPDELLLPLLEVYESNKPAVSIGDLARAIGDPPVKYTRVQSWIERARLRAAEPVDQFSGWAAVNDKDKKQPNTSTQWQAIEAKAEEGRLFHLEQVRRAQQLRPDLSAFEISMEMRERGLWPFGTAQQLTKLGLL